MANILKGIYLRKRSFSESFKEETVKKCIFATAVEG